MKNEGEVAQERLDEPGEDEMRSHTIDNNISDTETNLYKRLLSSIYTLDEPQRTDD